jgi:hypothetical protein
MLAHNLTLYSRYKVACIRRFIRVPTIQALPFMLILIFIAVITLKSQVLLNLSVKTYGFLGKIDPTCVTLLVVQLTILSF